MSELMCDSKASCTASSERPKKTKLLTDDLDGGLAGALASPVGGADGVGAAVLLS